eukprot:gene14177-16713_t
MSTTTTPLQQSGSSRAETPSYVVFKSKGHVNTTHTPTDLHPVHPWLLYADQDNNIVIQNYVTSQRILNFSISQHEEEKREQQLLQRRIPTLASLSSNALNLTYLAGNAPHINAQNGTTTTVNGMATSTLPSSPVITSNLLHSPQQQSLQHRSPNNTVRASNSSASLHDNISTPSTRTTTIGDSSDLTSEKLEKLGQIRFLFFYDRHTRATKDRKPKTAQGKLANSGNHGTKASIGLDDYIVVVADNRIVFLNYHSHRLRDVKVPIFELKPPTSIEFFANSPIVAFGCSDSIIRLWNTEKWELEKPLTGGHSKANTTILKLRSVEADGDLLVSAGSDGLACVWNMRTCTLVAQLPRVHEIIDISYDYALGQLLLLSSDKMVVIYDMTTMKEVSKVALGKREFQSVDAFYHPRFSQDLVLTMKSPAQIVVMSRSGTNTREHVIDFDAILNAGTKKEKLRLYKVAQHPLMPHLWLVWANRNIYLISTMASSVPVFATGQVAGVDVVFFPSQGCLCHVPLSNVLTSDKTMVKEVVLAANDPIKLDVSPSGKYLSVLMLSSGLYQVFEIGSWKVLEKGVALDIAWSSRGINSEKFGRVERIFEAVDPIKKKKPMMNISMLPKKTKKEEEAASRIVLKTREIGGINATSELALHSNEDRLSGGLLLGIYGRDLPNNSNSPGASTGNNNSNNNSSSMDTPIQPTAEETESKTFQQYDWWTLQPIGEPLTPPLKVYWDQSQTHCVFAYTHHFILFKLRPSIHFLCRWPLSLTSALWHNNTLFFSTHTDIQCSSSSGNVFPEDLYDVASGSLANSVKVGQTFSQLPNFRPMGAIGLVEVNNEGLVVIDANYKLYCIPLTHYLLKFFVLAQTEMVESAIKCASMVDPKYHYLMAKFLTVRSHPRECLQLSGISNYLKFQICTNNQAYESSLDIVPQLADSIRNQQLISSESNISPEENTLTHLGKKCIEIGHLCQAKNDYELAERAFKIATTLEPHSPQEVSAKIPVGRFKQVVAINKKAVRDPRFDNLGGKFDERFFRSQYGFLDEIIRRDIDRMTEKLKATEDDDEYYRLDKELQSLKSKLHAQEIRDKQRKMKEEWEEQEVEKVRQGKKPFYLTKKSLKDIEIAQQYKHLKSKGQQHVDNFMEKKRKKISSKDRLYVPFKRRSVAQDD